MVVHDRYKEYYCSWLRSSQITNCVENSSTGSGNLKIRNRESPYVRAIKTMQSFEAKLFKIGSWTLLRLPKSASARLPSRGMTMVEGTINDFRFQAALEPDGKGSHWFRVDKAISKAIGADAGNT